MTKIIYAVGIHSDGGLNILEKFLNNDHLLKLLFVILPFNKMTGILFFFRFLNIFGHISESTKKAA